MPKVITDDGIDIYYESYGEGQPIIFIHPPLMGHVVFQYQKTLQKHFRVILYDCRGHGYSGYRRPIDVNKAHVGDLRALVTHLGLHKPVIAGYSNGGVLALEYALAYPDDISALVLSGGYPKTSGWLLRQEYKTGIWLMNHKKKGFLSGVLAKTHKVTEEDERELGRYAKKAKFEAVADLYEAGLNHDATDRLHLIKDLPVLAVYGGKSRYINKHRKMFEEQLHALTIKFIEKGTHQLPTRFHEELNEIISDFLLKQRV